MKTKCPYCNYEAIEHETLDGQKNPEEGDVSFCIKCGEVGAYKKDKLVKVDLNSLEKLMRLEIDDIRVAWLKAKQLNKFTKQGIRE